MQDINNLIKKLQTLIKEREEELKENKFNEEMLDYEFSQLNLQKANINLEISNNNAKKCKIQKLESNKNQELIVTVILSILSVSLVAFTSMMIFNAVLELSVLKTILFSILTTSLSSPFIILNESKEYRKLKKELGDNNLENICDILDKNNNELVSILSKQQKNSKKQMDFCKRDKEIRKEIKEFKEDIELLTAIKYMTIEESLKCNETLKKVLNDISKEQQNEEEKGYQKTKK